MQATRPSKHELHPHRQKQFTHTIAPKIRIDSHIRPSNQYSYPSSDRATPPVRHVRSKEDRSESYLLLLGDLLPELGGLLPYRFHSRNQSHNTTALSTATRSGTVTSGQRSESEDAGKGVRTDERGIGRRCICFLLAFFSDALTGNRSRVKGTLRSILKAVTVMQNFLHWEAQS